MWTVELNGQIVAQGEGVKPTVIENSNGRWDVKTEDWEIIKGAAEKPVVKNK